MAKVKIEIAAATDVDIFRIEQWNHSVDELLALVFISVHSHFDNISRCHINRDDSEYSTRMLFKVKYFMRKWLLPERLPIKFIECHKHLKSVQTNRQH